MNYLRNCCYHNFCQYSTTVIWLLLPSTTIPVDKPPLIQNFLLTRHNFHNFLGNDESNQIRKKATAKMHSNQRKGMHHHHLGYFNAVN